MYLFPMDLLDKPKAMPKKIHPKYNSSPLNPLVTKKKVIARAVQANTRASLFSLIKFLVLPFNSKAIDN